MVYAEKLCVTSNHGIPTFHNVTEQVKSILSKSGIKTGIVTVYSHHTTCCVITQEAAFDVSMTGLETLQMDFIEIFEKIAPTQRKEGQYLHPGPKAIAFAAEHGENERGCHNTDAHLRSAIVGRSETFPVYNGEMDLGEFGYIYFIDFDQTRSRKRTVDVVVIGE